MAKYFAVKNWDKFQSGKTNKPVLWLKDFSNQGIDDPEIARLTLFQRAVLQECRRLRARLGSNIPADPQWVCRAVAAPPQDRHNMVTAMGLLSSRGFLIPTNQQHGTLEKSREYKEENKKEKKEEKSGSDLFFSDSPESQTESVPQQTTLPAGTSGATPPAVVLDTKTPVLREVNPAELATLAAHFTRMVPLAWDSGMLEKLERSVNAMLQHASDETIRKVLNKGRQHFLETDTPFSTALVEQVGFALIQHQCPVTTCRAVFKIDRTQVVHNRHACPACGYSCTPSDSVVGSDPVTPERVAELKRFADDNARRAELEATPEHQTARAKEVAEAEARLAWADAIRSAVIVRVDKIAADNPDEDAPIFNEDNLSALDIVRSFGQADEEVIQSFVNRCLQEMSEGAHA